MSLKAAIYARVSTKDKGQDPENQLLPLRAAAAAQNWTVAREYVEHESASTTARRAQFTQMMKDADAGQFQVLMFWSLDRFSREGVTATLDHLQRLTKAGVEWMSHQEAYLNTTSLGPFKDVVIGVIAAVAQLETNRRSDRVKAALDKKRARGEHVGGKRIPMNVGELERLYKAEHPIAAIARHFEVSRGTILNRLDELGLRQTKEKAS